MRVIVVHKPGSGLAGAPLDEIIQEMRDQNLRPLLVPLKKVDRNCRGDIVFMYNAGYRVHRDRIDKMKTPVFNVPFSGYGKDRQYEFFRAAGVSIPKFSVVDENYDLKNVEKEFGFPVITKPPIGTGGRGVVLNKNLHELEKSLSVSCKKLILQEYIKEASKGDVRALVIDGNVVACLWRTPAKGKITSNFHSGGKPSVYSMSDEEKSEAIKAAGSVGLTVAGVDIVPTTDGPKVFEANSLPDFMHMKEVAGVNPIPALVSAIKKKASEA